MKPHQLIARYIKGQMAMADVTQAQVAEWLGITPQAVSRRMKGLTPFSIDELTTLVARLGLDYGQMVNEVQQMSQRRNDVRH